MCICKMSGIDTGEVRIKIKSVKILLNGITIAVLAESIMEA